MRKLATHDGTRENGYATSPSDTGDPDQTPVYLVREAGTLSALSVASPHLADPQRARDFEMQVIEDETEAGA
jgi:hypothetical protein